MDTNTGIHRGTNRRGRARRGATSPASRLEQGTFRSIVPQKMELNSPQSPSSSRDPVPSSGKMSLMASVSRSSGLGKDGDDLKNWNIQEEYRKFIQVKLDHVLQSRPSETETEKKSRLGNQDNVLILFRKLREGVASSDRNDKFALEVYETSLYLSIIFDSPKQTTSIIPHLFPPEPDPMNAPSTLILQPSLCSVLCALLHHLVAYYPSQSQYHQHLRSVNEGILPRNSDAFLWFSSLTRTLRTRNYARLAVLGNHSGISNVISQSLKTSDSQIVNSNLAHDAVLCLQDALRQKAAETAWGIIRSAYREFSTDKVGEVTRAWLRRSLFLESVYDCNRSIEAVEWLESKVAVGYVRKKEGQERWVVCKAR